ncbi:hypothetical protein EUGRSUZ_K03139 [Eucalyptus grandis]|uniref:Uncharacterized protein n=2 Tax=Eucalyptus grandis TaxID=71139 RepID=A0ACC3J002_EUCGR|nr:hypothetical protein EUGRSUZ_K03139 [Eucalyptus grandis]
MLLYFTFAFEHRTEMAKTSRMKVKAASFCVSKNDGVLDNDIRGRSDPLCDGNPTRVWTGYDFHNDRLHYQGEKPS